MQVTAEGKRVFVTAGASGIGRATALAFREAGARVHICDVDAKALATMAELGIGVSQADVSSSREIDAVFSDIEVKWGGLDILVNNAGIAGPTKLVEDITDSEWDATVAVNINGAFYCVRRAVPMMKRQKSGAIINISSTAGRIGMPMRTPYSTTKYAVRGLTDVLAIELGSHNIRVNAVLPGLIDGPRGKRVVDEQADAKGIDRQAYLAAMLHNISLHALISMEEVAAMVLYLGSDWAKHISGQSFGVCGNFESYRSPLTIEETTLTFSV